MKRGIFLMMITVAGCTAAPAIAKSTAPFYNPVVTQATIGTTICRTGWTATVRPPVAYTSKIKSDLLAALPAGSDKNAADYELDHRVPLEVGGSPANPANLQLELWPEAHAKDSVENRVHAEVCAGKVTLAVGRRCFLANWHTCP